MGKAATWSMARYLKCPVTCKFRQCLLIKWPIASTMQNWPEACNWVTLWIYNTSISLEYPLKSRISMKNIRNWYSRGNLQQIERKNSSFRFYRYIQRLVLEGKFRIIIWKPFEQFEINSRNMNDNFPQIIMYFMIFLRKQHYKMIFYIVELYQGHSDFKRLTISV